MKKLITFFLVLCIAAGCTPLAPERLPGDDPVVTPEPAVRNIILMIADGTGVGAWTAADYANDRLAIKKMPVIGLVDTRSAMHKVTDSAAGASVYATGQRTVNRTISVGPASACPFPQKDDSREWPAGCEGLQTWVELARDKGRWTGVVTTTLVVDATPAAFVAHAPSRYWLDEIAEQVAGFGLDVLLGGGSRYFSASTRADGRDILAEMCAHARCLSTARDLAAYRPDDRPLVGLFADDDMDALEQRPVGLPEMVGAALAKLDQGSDGFVAVFETEATDNSTHANAPLDRVTEDLLEFDRAVAVALEFVGRSPDTLLVVTADHETGGFALAEMGTDFELKYVTHGHSAAMVPLFAIGPQAERFGGLRENYEIGQLFMDIVSTW